MASTATAWRSPPPPAETPLVEPASLPSFSPLQRDMLSPPPLARNGNHDGLHPSFLPPCDHSDGDLHAHAFDLLSLAAAPQHKAKNPSPKGSSAAVPSSVPAQSFLSSTRPGNAPQINDTPLAAGIASGSAPKPRRMSSSTTGVLGRGKLGLTGEGVPNGKDARPILTTHATSYTSASPIPNRRPVPTPSPQLFDFAKTDRRPSQPKLAGVPAPAKSFNAAVPASLPNRSLLQAHASKVHPPAATADDIELDMAFDGDDDDDGEVSAGGDFDMDMDLDGEEGEEWRRLALGSGSGGVKGRRKGMVFKCETCKKEYRHPSCLVKHRWEHSPHWKEPTQLSMSKHQQVQILEAAAILAHLDAGSGKNLPSDKSLWPAILSPPGGEIHIRRVSRDHSAIRSPPSSTIAPMTPSSLRDPSSLSGISEVNVKERRTSPGSDSTTSSMGAGEPYVPVPPSSYTQRKPSFHRPPVGIESTRKPSFSSSLPGGTPHSVGSLPSQMARLGFNPGHSPSGRAFVNTTVPSSSIRSGVEDLPEDEEEDEWVGAPRSRSGKSSSEEAEERRKEEEYGLAMEMEL